MIQKIISDFWAIADLLRGDFKHSQYGRIILPFCLLRTLECILENSKEAVLAEYEKTQNMSISEAIQEKMLLRTTDGLPFFNISKMTLAKLGKIDIKINLEKYILSFSSNVRDIFEHFNFFESISQLNDSNLLYNVVQKARTIDLSPYKTRNQDMVFIFEELIHRFINSSNETSGEHFTPFDIVKLITSLVFIEDDAALSQEGIIRTVYDPTAGSGGFLSAGIEYFHNLNPNALIGVFGQEMNAESYAICKATMLIKGQDVSNIKLGNTLSNDLLCSHKFDYMLSHPPFGLAWKRIEQYILEEHKNKGFSGRFGPGLPRVSDSSLLFLLHLISKMHEQSEGGSRIGIILSASPLFIGDAGSGESEIRRYIIESDLLEAIISLPTDIFFNTGIATYIWILSNKKSSPRKGKIQIINAVDLYSSTREIKDNKNKILTPDDINQILMIYFRNENKEFSKIIDNKDLGYRRITIERPLRIKYQITAANIALLKTKIFNLKKYDTLNIINVISMLDQNAMYFNKDNFTKSLQKTFDQNKLKLDSQLLKIILHTFGKKDIAGDIIFNANNKPEPDPELREFENIPLNFSIDLYFEKEVKPLFSDAWINSNIRDPQDSQIGIIGYKIDFKNIFKFPKTSDPLAVKIKSLILPGDCHIFFNKNKKNFYQSLEPKNKNDISINLDPKRINIEYINAYFQSDEGQDWLNHYKTGHTSSSITKETLLSARLLLPSLEQQTKIIELIKNKNKIQDEIDIISREIWLDIDKSEQLLDRYTNVNKKDDNDFVTHLPYPLAVLFNHASNEIDNKTACEVYLQFFECLGALSLGAVIENISNKNHNILKKGNRNPITMAYYYQRLKTIADEGHISDFRSASIIFVNQKFISILEEATKLRNEIAHSGIPNNKIIDKRLKIISNLIEQLRMLTKDFFSEYKLFRALHATWSSETYTYTIHVFSGLACSPFNKSKIKVSSPLIDGELYWGAIYGGDICQCYKASSFIKMHEIEDGLGIEDFYFYNRINSENEAIYRCPYQSVRESTIIPSDIKNFLGLTA